MCVEIVTPSGVLCGTIGELVAATGRVVPILAGYPIGTHRDHECCLCPVDTRKLAKRQKWRLDNYTQPMRYFAISRKAASEPTR